MSLSDIFHRWNIRFAPGIYSLILDFRLFASWQLWMDRMNVSLYLPLGTFPRTASSLALWIGARYSDEGFIVDRLFSGRYTGEDDGAAEHSRRANFPTLWSMRMSCDLCSFWQWNGLQHRILATEIRCLVGYAKMYDFLYLPRDFKAKHLQCFGICRHV